MPNKLVFFSDENKVDYERFERFANKNVYNVYTQDDHSRIVVWTNKAVHALIDLFMEMKEPYFILYILSVSRCDQETARYQSMELSTSDTEELLYEFADYLESDGRHDIWIHSPKDNATIVYDKDNLIYIYGNLEAYEKKLLVMGYTRYNEPLFLPSPHAHCYHAEYDEKEIEILKRIHWYKTPLQQHDY
ncbi:hypothetical protein [Gorillibacterium sp. sgz5001074]|uniref:hypothetical protein n=1 Tax=Gorillibacterium sp. sgz5001074 TaxID=3446695 RepID=UPI003F6809FF